MLNCIFYYQARYSEEMLPNALWGCEYLVDFGALDFQDLAHEHRPLRDESLLHFYRLIDLE